jgi:hypothetical protein
MIHKLEELLRELSSGNIQATDEFTLSQPDPGEDGEEFNDTILITFEDGQGISCDLTWSYTRKTGDRETRDQPADQDNLVLDYVDITNVAYLDTDGNENELGDLSESPEAKNMLYSYLIDKLSEITDDTSREVQSKITKTAPSNEIDQQVQEYMAESKVLRFNEFQKQR